MLVKIARSYAQNKMMCFFLNIVKTHISGTESLYFYYSNFNAKTACSVNNWTVETFRYMFLLW